MRSIAVLAVLACLVTAASADDDVPYAADAHRPHRWSMQFTVADNFRLTSFEGAGLAVTRNTSASNAWRLGLSWTGRFLKDDGFNRVTVNDSTVNDQPQPSADTDQVGASLDLLRLHRFHPGRRAGVELGLGPRVSYNRLRQRLESQATYGWSVERTRDLFVGVAGRFGAEMFLARAVSLHAHYGARLGYEEHLRESELETEFQHRLNHRRSHGAAILTEGVTFGLSVYL